MRATLDLATGDLQVRSLTAEEQADRDALAAEAAADEQSKQTRQAEFQDVPKWARALFVWTAQKTGTSLATARTEIKAIFESL